MAGLSAVGRRFRGQIGKVGIVMSDDSTAEQLAEGRQEEVFALLDEWEERRQVGTDVTPEELCQHRPDLLADLKRRLRQLRATEWMAAEQPGFSLPIETTARHDGPTPAASKPVPAEPYTVRAEAPRTDPQPHPSTLEEHQPVQNLQGERLPRP